MSDDLEFGGEDAEVPAGDAGDDRFQSGPWHVRFAGRRTGPHDVERLRTLARRGAVTRLHQVSVDGKAWRPASDIRAVFTADGTVIAGGAAPAADVQVDDDRLQFPEGPTEDAMPAAPVVRRFTAGIEDEGEVLKAERVRIVQANNSHSTVELELAQGRNREVRRLFAALGHEVVELRRTQVGPVRLGELPTGKWRVLSAAEVKSLLPGNA